MSAPERHALVTWSGFATFYVALTVAYAWPLIGAITTALPHDIADPGLNAWILWWNVQAVPLTDRWWNAPIFHPLQGAFALSETMLSLSMVSTPMLLSGASAVTAYNVTFLVSFPLTALAAHALAHRLTGRHDAALLAGLAFGFNPYRASQMPHIQMQWAMWMPLVLLALHRYLDTRRRRDLAVAGVCWLLNGLTSGYFLVFFAVLVALWVVWFARSIRDWIAIGITCAIASLPLIPLLIGYASHQAALGLSRNLEEISLFSADLTALAAASRDVWLPSHWTMTPQPEGELYPGLAILVLTGAGALVVWRRRRTRAWTKVQIAAALAGVAVGAAALMAPAGGWELDLAGLSISLTRVSKAVFTAGCLIAGAIIIDRRMVDGWRRRSLLLFYAAAALVMFLFALGPEGRAFGTTFFYQPPYSWLMALPGGYALRVPARFATLMMLCLSQAAALGYCRLTPGGARRAVVAALALTVILDGWVLHFPVAPVPRTEAVTPTLDVRLPIAELPIEDDFSDAAAMVRATRHGHPLINGFSGYTLVHYELLKLALAERDATVLDVIRRFGPFVAVIDRSRDPNGELERFIASLSGARWLFRAPLGSAYELPAVRRPDRDTHAPRVPIAYVEATSGQTLLARMLDEDVTTSWQTEKPQSSGVEVAVVLPQPVEVTRLEMDLGRWSLDYPRRLRVERASGEGEAPVSVWDGGMAGEAMLGLVADRARTTLTVDLPPGTVSRRFVLSLRQDHKVFHWTIAELRAYGRPR